MPRFNSGKNAKATCDRCSFVYPYKQMTMELSGIWVCETCYDGQFQRLNHPQLKPPIPKPDAPLERPRPDAVLEPASVSTGGLRYL